jgi:hypothetical protein
VGDYWCNPAGNTTHPTAQEKNVPTINDQKKKSTRYLPHLKQKANTLGLNIKYDTAMKDKFDIEIAELEDSKKSNNYNKTTGRRRRSDDVNNNGNGRSRVQTTSNKRHKKNNGKIASKTQESNKRKVNGKNARTVLSNVDNDDSDDE